MKAVGELVVIVWYVYSLFYAFAYWGLWWGIASILFPFAPLWDLVIKLGKI